MNSYFQLSMPRRQAQRRKIPTSYAHVLTHEDIVIFISSLFVKTLHPIVGAVFYTSLARYMYIHLNLKRRIMQ